MVTINYEARLTLVQAAIARILTAGAQTVTMDDGTSVTHLDLAALQREEARLVAQINRANRRGGAFRVAAPQ